MYENIHKIHLYMYIFIYLYVYIEAARIFTAFLRHAAQCLFYFLQNAVYFIILHFSIQIIMFYINQAQKFK